MSSYDLLELSISEMTSTSDCDAFDVVDDTELIAILSSINQCPAVVEAMNVEEEDGLPSRGAIYHASGDCNPCSYFLKRSGGCTAGRNCEFCHACDSMTAVKRKQKKLSKARKLEAKKKAYGEKGNLNPSSLRAEPQKRNRWCYTKEENATAVCRFPMQEFRMPMPMMV